MAEEMDLVPEDSQEESQEEIQEESQEETSETNEDIKREQSGESTIKLDLEPSMRGLHRGYTQTRQDLSELRNDIAAIRAAIESKSKDEYGEYEEEKPLTRKDIQDIFVKEREAKTVEDQKINKHIDGQLADLYASGEIKTKEDEDKLLNFAIKHKEGDLIKAISFWKEVEAAKKEGQKEGVKGKVKQEVGGKVGSSQKAGSTDQGIDYQTIQKKSFYELAE